MKTLTILSVLTLVLVVVSQGGGGGHRGGSSGSRRSGYRHHAAPFIPPRSGCNKQDCFNLKKECDAKCNARFTADNEQTFKSECLQECVEQYGAHKEGGYTIPLLMIGGFVAVVVWSQKNKKGEDHEYLLAHRQRVEGLERSCDELEQNFRSLARRKYSMTFYQGNNRFNTGAFQITGSKASNEKLLYNITILSGDTFGTWTGKGYIGYTSQGITIWFSKVYNDRTRAGQTGRWWSLIYEGKWMEESSSFSGKWYYKNFEHDPLYSGTWDTLSSKME